MRIAGARLGLYASGARALSGEELDSMDLDHLRRVINEVGVFYRTTPRHKLKIVKVSEINVVCKSSSWSYLMIVFVVCVFFFFFKEEEKNNCIIDTTQGFVVYLFSTLFENLAGKHFQLVSLMVCFP
jgi:hypothetical protein